MPDRKSGAETIKHPKHFQNKTIPCLERLIFHGAKGIRTFQIHLFGKNRHNMCGFLHHGLSEPRCK